MESQKIPKGFVLMQDLNKLKQTVASDLEEGNLNRLLNESGKRTERNEINNIINEYDKEEEKQGY